MDYSEIYLKLAIAAVALIALYFLTDKDDSETKDS